VSRSASFLRLVPGLFYVKCLGRKDVPRFHVFSRARVYAVAMPDISPNARIDMEHVEHVEQGMFSID
jgi:hypothetical protein